MRTLFRGAGKSDCRMFVCLKSSKLLPVNNIISPPRFPGSADGCLAAGGLCDSLCARESTIRSVPGMWVTNVPLDEAAAVILFGPQNPGETWAVQSRKLDVD